MAQRLFDALARPVTLRVSRPLFMLGSIALLTLVISGIAAATAPGAPVCAQGVCQCWYCRDYEWAWDPETGRNEPTCKSPCTEGCVGNCDRGYCAAAAGQGGCGPICRPCQQGTCAVAPVPTENPPTPQPTRTPPPVPEGCSHLAPGEKKEWTRIIPPTIGKPDYRPDHPVAVEQDPNRIGFEIHLVFRGGRYEHQTQELEEWCGPVSAGQTRGRHPRDCPDSEYHYECPVRCAECYDDPLDTGQIRMRLADPTVDWIQKELAARYPGAQPKEGLPRVWQLAGLKDRMTYEAWWRYAPGAPDYLTAGPVDPGIHGGQIYIWTKGTPKSRPQVVNHPFEVPVYLLDTTIAE